MYKYPVHESRHTGTKFEEMPLLVPSAYTYTCVHTNEGSAIEKPAEKFGISQVNFELRVGSTFMC